MVAGFSRVIAISFLILALAATLICFRPFFGNFSKIQTVHTISQDTTPTHALTAEDLAEKLASTPNTQMPEEDAHTDFMVVSADHGLSLSISFENFFVTHSALFPVTLPLESPPPRA